MLRKKKLLGRKESSAYEGLCSSTNKHGWHVFPKVKLGEIVDLDFLSSLSNRDFKQAENMCFDFAVCSEQFDPLLGIDMVYSDADQFECDSGFREVIASQLELGLVLVDCSMLAAYQVAELMQALLTDWYEICHSSNLSEFKFEYRGCLLHLSSCDPSSCNEFASISHVLLDSQFEETQEFVKKIRIGTETESGTGGFFESAIYLVREERKFELARGRCRVFGPACSLGPLLSMHIAASIASRTFEDARNFVFKSEEPCLLEAQLTKNPLVESEDYARLIPGGACLCI